MKKRFLALLTAGAVALSLLGISVLAATTDGESEELTAQSEPEQTPVVLDEQSGEESVQKEEKQTPDEIGGAWTPPVYVPDPVGSITFENLERRLRENNLTLLALEENIQSIEVIDYDKMYEDLRQSLNDIANAQWMMIIYGMGETPEAKALEQSYDALRETFDSLKEGELQKDNEDAIWQLENAQNQVVMAGESLYIAIIEMEQNRQTLQRNLDALDRSLEELELRYELGQISSQTLKQTQATRTSLLSSKQTLDSNIQNYKMQLELMAGGELNGQIQLGELPGVTDKQLTDMNLEADLETAKENSYSLYEAEQTLDEAHETYEDNGGQYAATSDKYQYASAAHTYEAAKYNYNATIQNFEISFRTLYLQVKDFKQVLDAAKTALAVEQDNYSVSQLKYEQGNLSLNDLLEAEDKVKEAQETVDGAENDLFSAYHNYRWAVDYGILN